MIETSASEQHVNPLPQRPGQTSRTIGQKDRTEAAKKDIRAEDLKSRTIEPTVRTAKTFFVGCGWEAADWILIGRNANKSLNLVCLNQNDLKRKKILGKSSTGKLHCGKSFNGNST